MKHRTVKIRVPKVGRRRHFGLFALMSLAAVFIVAWASSQWYQQFHPEIPAASAPGVQSVATTSILVALTDIAIQETLDVTNVRSEEWPADRVPDGVLVDVAELDGCVARFRLYIGEPILHAKTIRLKGQKDRE